MLSYLVTQRTKEIGIRLALGATVAAVTGLVVGQAMRLAVAGAALGTVLSFVVSRLFATQLIFVVFLNASSALVYAQTITLIIAASLAAAYLPARSAARIDPLTTMRYE